MSDRGPDAASSRPWAEPRVFGDPSAPVLLGVPPAQGHWSVLEPALRPLTVAGWRVALVSLRGEREHGPVPPFDLDDLVDDLEATVQRLGCERLSLFGASFGGAVALAYASRHPGRVERLVACVTAARLDAHQGVARLLDRLPGRLRGPAFHVWAVWRCLPELVAAPDRRGARRRLRRIARHGRTPDEVLLARLRLLLAVDLREDVAALDVPTLVLSGARRLDRLVPWRCQSELVSLLARARHDVVPRTGHLGCVTAPERVRARVAAFLASAPDP